MAASVHYFSFYPPPSDQHPLPSPFPAPSHHSPPPSYIFPSPPSPPNHPLQPPPLPHFPPPPYPRPHLPPPPPHVLPPPPGHHSTVIIVIVISLGSLFFLAFLAAALFCCLKKRRTSSLKTEITKFDEHIKVQEVIVPGPHGEPTRVVMLEEDIHLEENIHKTGRASHLNSTGGHATDISDPNHHLIEHKA
ncbi:unnamed protein product [Microthlaspi erraticum]|uniref:Uncharacterized protein n=1 Tax=Microthlaspi erraticum TaxID=1685480 RepID=A0A6D2L4V2_9BRAS|nr:unnamed protein product [Microthlaspi erraticum]